MTTTKLTDFVADFLASQGIGHAFVVSGGASIHLMHSIAAHDGVEHICPHHEQAGAMAADAYARVTGGIGCAIGTSGPGATNMVTGIAGAWFDSVPMLVITGQVTTFRMKGETGVRQYGFQETEIIPMVRPITKYAVQIRDPLRIRYELEKAVHIAKSPRRGPVLIDIPDDLQRSMIDVEALEGFVAEETDAADRPGSAHSELDRVIALANEAERPILVLGWGIRLAEATVAARALVDRLGFPVLTTWGARDMLPADHPLLAGTFGTHGTRAGNFAIQNADLVLSIGARLSTRETGSPMESWAREAETIVVDVDPTELGKFAHFGKQIDLPICCDAGRFIEDLLGRASEIRTPDIAAWRSRVAGWQTAYPVCPPNLMSEAHVNPYVFMEALSKAAPENEHIFVDTGCAVAWLMQGFRVSGAQRLYHDFNNTAMGWALPAAIAGSLATGHGAVTCIAGDGSMMMNLQELATLRRHRLPVRLFILNNGGYGMVQQTQEQWLDGNYVGTSHEGGLYFPDFCAVATAFDIAHLTVERNDDVEETVRQALTQPGPVVVDVRIPRTQRVIPQSRFGYPIEDSEPLLPREEFLANMIVEPMPMSREPIG